jgi:murein DD-endopeptidase MepM/ murein hydrolase activator NlpD
MFRFFLGIIVVIAFFMLRTAQPAQPGLQGSFTSAPEVPPESVASQSKEILPTIESITPLAVVGQQAELWPGASVCYGYHDGAMDWCAPLGTEVVSPANCYFSGQGEYHDDPKFGAYMICNTANGLEIYVGHLDMATVNPLGFGSGDFIAAGQVIGYIGPHFITTHVHTQLKRDRALISPDAWWSEWDNR